MTDPTPLSSTAIAASVGVALSLVLAFVPGLKSKFAAVPSNDKPLLVLALCALTAVVLTGLACFGVDTGSGATCPALDVSSLWPIVANVIAAAGTAQVTFALLVNPAKGNAQG